jgi:hypothetical protein
MKGLYLNSRVGVAWRGMASPPLARLEVHAAKGALLPRKTASCGPLCRTIALDRGSLARLGCGLFVHHPMPPNTAKRGARPPRKSSAYVTGRQGDRATGHLATQRRASSDSGQYQHPIILRQKGHFLPRNFLITTPTSPVHSILFLVRRFRVFL